MHVCTLCTPTYQITSSKIKKSLQNYQRSVIQGCLGLTLVSIVFPFVAMAPSYPDKFGPLAITKRLIVLAWGQLLHNIHNKSVNNATQFTWTRSTPISIETNIFLFHFDKVDSLHAKTSNDFSDNVGHLLLPWRTTAHLGRDESTTG